MTNDHGASQASSADVSLIETPPTTYMGILSRLGPGLIIAGSIVGSGELIATTKTGAEAGFWLLWLILIGCVIKVFVQVEMGRYSVTSGKTAMDGLAEVPGPRIRGHGNWLIWFWSLVFLATIGQVGGIVGGVGQALQISVPITESGRAFNEQVNAETQYTVVTAELRVLEERGGPTDEESRQRAAELSSEAEQLGPVIVQSRMNFAGEQLAQLRRQVTASSASDLPTKLANLEAAYQLAESRVETHGMRPELVFRATDDDVQSHGEEVRDALSSLGRRSSRDDEIWALLIAVITAVVLVIGRYGMIQSFSTVLVASFTFITVVNLIMLQNNQFWGATWQDIKNGMSFQLPPPPPGALKATGVATALATFGIIGVGANELIAYPYWCLEKGYARFTGPRDDSADWAERARGWMRVMRWDAWCSMVVYTFATLAFYLLGAAILWRAGLNPANDEMVRTLGVMYEPVFGSIARWVFLFGAFAVLYSTFFVATASLARVVPDALRVIGFGPKNEQSYRRWIQVFSALFPMMCVLSYSVLSSPDQLVLIGGVMQGIMLPMLAGAALYFRYQRSDSRITPGLIWDLFLWGSAAGMLITGLWTVWTKLEPLFSS